MGAIQLEAKSLCIKFLDFERFPEWHEGFTIEAQKTPVEVGDKLNVNAGGMKFSPTVLVCTGEQARFIADGDKENSDEELRWLGSLPYLFSGKNAYVSSTAL